MKARARWLDTEPCPWSDSRHGPASDEEPRLAVNGSRGHGRFTALSLLFWGALCHPGDIQADDVILEDPIGFTWDIDADGYGHVIGGTSGAYAAWPDLCVRAPGAEGACTSEETYQVSSNASLELDGRQIVMASMAIGSVNVRRKIYVPASGSGFVRHMEIISNPAARLVAVTVRLGSVSDTSGLLGSDISTQITSSENGDTVLNPGDDWWCSDDDLNGLGVPALAHVVAGAGGRYGVGKVAVGAFGDNAGSVYWEHQNVAIPARGTVIILHYEAQTARQEEAAERAVLLYGEPDEILAGLTSDEARDVVNWDLNVVPTADAGGPYSGQEGAQIAVNASGSTDPNGNIALYEWDCDGDGAYDVASPNPDASTCTFPDDGAYSVRLRVTDATGFDDTDTATASLSNVAPTLTQFDVPPEGLEGESLSFAATASDPGTEDRLSYLWDFGDDSNSTDSSPTHIYADEGTYTVQLTVTDGDGGAVSELAEVVIENQPPEILNLTAPSSSNEGAAVYLVVVVFDSGLNDVLTFTWDFGDGATQTGIDLTATTHTYLDQGEYLVTLTVTDDSDAFASDSALITVSNVAPSIETINGVFDGNEGDTFAFDAVAEDPGEDPLTFSWSFGDGGSANGASVSHQYRDDGTYALILTVTDGDGGVAEASRLVRVENVAPEVVEVYGPDTEQEGREVAFSASAVDPGDDTISYSWDFGDEVSGEGSEVTHTYADDGTFVVVLLVSDEDGGAAERTLVLEITNANPTIASLSGPGGGMQGETLVYVALASDPGDDVLTYSWNFGDGSEVAGVDMTEVEHQYASEGPYVLSLTVSDEDGGEASTSRTINIGNDAPWVEAIGVVGDLEEGVALELSAVASDPGGDPLVFAWDFGDGSPVEEGLELSPVIHAYVDDGSYTVSVTVTDPGGLGGGLSTEVAVENVAPSIVEATVPSTVEEGTWITAEAVIADPGSDDVLTVSWEFGDGSSAYEDNPATHRYGQDGQYSIRLTVQDDDGGITTQSFLIEVANVAPVIEEITGPRALDEGETGVWTVAVLEPSDDALSYNWSFGDNTTSTDVQASHAYSRRGTYSLSLTVTDEDGASEEAWIDVVVANVVPEIVVVSLPTSGDEGDSLLFEVRASDAGGGPLEYEWDFGDDTPTSPQPSVEHVFADDGTYQVKVAVSDQDGGISTASAAVVIANVAPQVNSLEVPAQADEGAEIEAVASWSDPGDDTLAASITWGDGESSVIELEMPVKYHYRDDGRYEVRVKVADDENAITTSEPAFVDVRNVDPSIVSFEGTLYGGADEAFTFDAVATDPGVDDALTYTYEWGDGSAPDSGIDMTTATHSYAASGQYEVALTVSDGDGGTDSETLTANVSTGAPYIDGFEVPSEGDEAETLLFRGTGIDPLGQTVTYLWDFGDASPPLEGENLSEVTHAYADDGAYVVTLTVSDPDEMTAARFKDLSIANVPPVITSQPAPTEAVEGSLYSHQLEATDVAGEADPLAFSLLEAPGGMTISEAGTIVWTPDLEDAETGEIAFSIVVQDDDGGSASESVAVSVAVLDEDLDGMPDSWETLHGLDTGRDDSLEDPDDDGLSNIQEYQQQTDPTGSNAPGAPEVLSPDDEAEVVARPVSLVVLNALDPDDDPLVYEFQLYGDAALLDYVDGAEDVLEGDGFTQWQVGASLEENEDYWWRARAYDGRAFGPWSDISAFRVNIVNEPPTAPTPSYPDDGAAVAESFPRLEVTNASDPDGSRLTYSFEVYDEARARVAETSGLEEGVDGTTGWAVDVELVSGSAYSWRAMATDPLGVDGPWSEEVGFVVEADANPPSPPTLRSPEPVGEVNTLTPTLVAGNAEDPDNDPLVYRFQVDMDITFASPLLQDSGDVPEGDGGETRWTVTEPLEEDSSYFWRVRSDDGTSTSEWVTGTFRVVLANQPPGVPTLHNPSDGSSVPEGSLTLSLVPLEDPDGDEVTYTFLVRDTQGIEVYSDEGVEAGNDSLVISELDTFDLPGDTNTFDWTGFATDAFDQAGDEAEPNQFTIEREAGDDDTEPVGDDDSSGDDDATMGDDDQDIDNGGSCNCDVEASGGEGHLPRELLALVPLLWIVRRRVTRLHSRASGYP